MITITLNKDYSNKKRNQKIKVSGALYDSLKKKGLIDDEKKKAKKVKKVEDGDPEMGEVKQ